MCAMTAITRSMSTIPAVIAIVPNVRPWPRPGGWKHEKRSFYLSLIFTYFHSVFTLPHNINRLALCNKKVVYSLLFKSVSETLLAFGENPKNGMGGKLGVIGILHTWNQKLTDHIHLHFLVPGGVLSPDKTEFKTCSETFLFPVKALSKVFQGKFMEGLKEAFRKNELIFPGQAARFESPQGFYDLVADLWSTSWVVYSKPPFSGPETVLEYMACYTHRVAISNNRIASCENGQVTFSYKNRKKITTEAMTLDAVEFIRRFLLHVVPPNFMRIRHFGLFANRCKKKNIALCRALLGVKAPSGKADKKSIEDIMLTLTGEDIKRCPVCKKGVMQKRFEIPKYLHGTGSFHIIRPQYRRNTS